eukprot:sb/3464597/
MSTGLYVWRRRPDLSTLLLTQNRNGVLTIKTGFLSDKGGGYNGMTWTLGTGYYFYIQNEFWETPARMLASFIGYPTMFPERFDSAIAAVDSEYKRNINNNYRALLAVGLTYANPDSGYGPFSTGSSGSLNTSDIIDKAKAFHHRYYSGNLMYMAALSNMTLDSLESKIREIYEPISNTDQEPYVFSSHPFPNSTYLNKRFWIKSKNEDSSLNAANLPLENRTVDYLYYVMDSTGQRGSVYRYLQEKGYITGLYASSAVDKNMLTIVVSLTDKGLGEVDLIVKTVMSFLKSALKNGVNKVLWEQMMSKRERKFQHGGRADPAWIPSTILDNMESGAKPEGYLGAPSTIEFDADKENSVLRCLIPKNMNIYVVSGKYAVEGNEFCPPLTRTEKWYNTSYEMRNIKEAFLEQLENIEEDPELHLPIPHDFVPQNFEILPIVGDAPENPVRKINIL